jgi:hypothetical protein
MRRVMWLGVLGVCGLAGCFDPNYGDGGFACANGVCPEGYTCVTQGGNPVCRKNATPLPDLAQKLEPRPDAPARDTPGADRPREAAAQDRATDQPRVDQRVDRGVDLKADLKKDSLKPDLGPTLNCDPVLVLEPNVVKSPLAFDLLVDNGNTAHLVAAREAAALVVRSRTASGWSTATVAPSHDGQAALASSRVTVSGNPEDRLHVFFRQKNATMVSNPYHTWRKASAGGTWSAPTALTAAAVDSVEIGGSDKFLYATATVAAPRQLLAWTLVWGGSSYTATPLPSLTAPIYHPRLAVGPVGWVSSTFADVGGGIFRWQLQSSSHGGGTPTTNSLSATSTKDPAPIVIDTAGIVHGVLTRPAGTSLASTLHYFKWDRATPPQEQTLISTASVEHGTADLALDPAGRPYVVYVAAGVLRELHWTGSAWSSSSALAVAPSPLATRIGIDPGGKFMHVAFTSFGTQWDVSYLRCYTP